MTTSVLEDRPNIGKNLDDAPCEYAPDDDKSFWYCQAIVDMQNGKNEITLSQRHGNGALLFDVKQDDPDLENFYIVGKTYNLLIEEA